MVEKKKKTQTEDEAYGERQVGPIEDFEPMPNSETTGEDAVGDTSSRVEAPPGPLSTADAGGITEDLPPSANLVPGTSPEEFHMEMAPVVVGPPSYGSPDPATAAGRLAPLVDHPLADTLSEDYGADVEGVLSRGPLESTHPGGPGTADADAAARRAEEVAADEAGGGGEAAAGEGDEYDGMTKAELQDEARDRDIEGFSSMNKAELQEALRANDDGDTDES